MEAIRVRKKLKKDGEIRVVGLPFKKGESVEMIFLSEGESSPPKKKLTAGELLNSDLVGLWEHRKDIGDSVVFARKLREKAQRRKS